MITIHQAERSIFEAIRLAIVAAGYLPDITASATATEWETARATLAGGLGPNEALIDVFGVGSPEGRNEELINRVVLDREGSTPGSIGGAPGTRFELKSGTEGSAGAKYTKVALPAMSEDVTYEIITVSNHIVMDRKMRVIIKNVLKGRHYLPTVDDNGDQDGNYILVEFLGDVDKTVGKNMMKSFRYLVYDLYDEDSVTLRDDIASMDTINFQISTVGQEVDLGGLNAKGPWDADTNTPTLSDTTGNKNDYYSVHTGGVIDLGSGNITWALNDVCYHDGIKWKKLNQ